MSLQIFLIKGHVHHHDAEAGEYPHFKKKITSLQIFLALVIASVDYNIIESSFPNRG
jgi:hypothetical protein